MRLLSVVLGLLVLVSLAAVAEAGMAKDFVWWQLRFTKKYATRTELRSRFNKFRDSYDEITKLLAEGSETAGVDSPFMDVSRSEFKQMFKLDELEAFFASPPANVTRMTPEEIEMDNRRAMMAERGPDMLKGTKIYDWTTTNRILNPRNQNSCGSCWAFASTAIVEFVRSTTGYLSTQQILDCSGTGSCSGGWPDSALTYAKKGMTNEASYRYTNAKGTCRIANGPWAISNWQQNVGEAATGNWLRVYGPQVVVLYASGSNFQYYKSGTLMASRCGGTTINHAVQVTGWGTDAAGVAVWRIRNSWGTGWGAGGYITLQRNANACGIGQYGGWGAY